MDISIVIPLLNEDESIKELFEWIHRVMEKMQKSYEVIFVDDGSTDRSWQVIEEMAAQFPQVKGIKFRRNYGKSAGLQEGFSAAEGDVVFTMDADLQDSPEELPELFRMIKEEGYDLVSGWKKKRHDPLTKTIPTKLYNWTTRRMSGIKLHDFNCGLKAYKKDVVKSIEVYGEMHRYIPILAKAAGFEKIGEKVVQHQARKYGKTKFGWQRFVRGPLDVMSITFVGKFGKRPMHLFGSMGMLAFLAGFAMLAYLSYLKIFHNLYRISDRPLFFFGILLLIIGSQLFLTGFLAELVSRNSPNRNNYSVEKVV